jgi:hypothetical protein
VLINHIISDITANVLLFYGEIEADPHHRYCSWEHCYRFFQEQRQVDKGRNFELAMLNLAFYLASWGMYRGSSRLLQKDYHIHAEIVRELCHPKYDLLWNTDFGQTAVTDKEIDAVFDLAKAVGDIYARLGISPTDTLVTKVMLGTIGCVPAYDNYFAVGVAYWNKHLRMANEPTFPKRFGKNSYVGLLRFYQRNQTAFQEAQNYIKQRGQSYPAMKLLDMYFWNLGYQTTGR